jgi:hypothetical protein
MPDSRQAGLAPIVLFTYNRPEHTRLTLEYLSRCEWADASTLYVFCDGPKSDAGEDTLQKIKAVREVLLSRQWTGEIVIKSAETNKGLFKNVTEGVGEVIGKHGRCIVIEDDLKIGTSFLRYMNTALDTYALEDRVKQVSGFIFPADLPINHRALMMPLSNTIGWGTWARAWNEVDLSAGGHEALLSDRELSHRFNLNGTYDYSRMLVRQMANAQFGSWGVIYWWSIFKNNGLVVYPDYSLIQHNDFDHSGVHASDDTHYNYPTWDEHHAVNAFPGVAEGPDLRAFEKVCAHLRRRKVWSPKNVVIKVKTVLKRWL